MGAQQGKKAPEALAPLAGDLWSEISYFAWKRRPDAAQPSTPAKQVSARAA